MKIKNIFYIIATFIFLSSCATVETTDGYTQYPGLEKEKAIEKEFLERADPDKKLKVAAILPLTGKNAKIGKSMLNAINLSLFDNDHKDKIELLIFDNKSSEYNSKKAMKEVIKKDIKIVLGPIFSRSVESVIKSAVENNIIVLSFSNNSDLIDQHNIFLSGFFPEQEMDRIASYSIDEDHSNFSVIAPNNQYGIRISKTLREAVEMKDANFISSQFYMKNKEDFSKIAKKIINSYIVSPEVEEYKEELELIEDKDERQARELEIIAEHKIYTDTILIAESGSKVFAIAKAIEENNVDGKDIQIIGISHWNKNSILDNGNLAGSWFAAPDDKYYAKFKEKYNQIYGQDPIRISSIAYDVTAFVIDLADDIKNYTPTSEDITNYNKKKGYRGIDGLFRFLPNGLIERNLSVMKIYDDKIKVIDRAPRRLLKY